jgi:hypothetical protein
MKESEIQKELKRKEETRWERLNKFKPNQEESFFLPHPCGKAVRKAKV